MNNVQLSGSYVAKGAKFSTKAASKLKKGKATGRVRKAINACNCFTAGTKVLTDEGEKNIEDIEVGDKVLSKDEETGEEAYKEVTATFNHETDEIYKIHVGDQIIESTFNHPFWVDGKGWTFVKDLKVGDLLVQSDGNTLKIESIELEHKHVTVYNMTVDEFHTYFVSDLGIWVHNTKCYNDYNKIVHGDNSLYKILKEDTDWMKDNGLVYKGVDNKRKTWFDGKDWYKWDSQHGKLEVWDKKKKNHLEKLTLLQGRKLKMVLAKEIGRVDMVHGKRFLEEYPKYKDILEKLYLKRELDNWYVDKCRKPLVLPNEIINIQMSKLKIQDGFNPSAHVYLTLEELKGEGGFSLVQEIQITISKIIPVYHYVLLHKINHSSLDGFLGLSRSG